MAKPKRKQAKRTETFDEKFRDRYTVDKSVRTPSGGYSISNRDEVARALNGLTVEQLAQVAARAGLADRIKRWAHLNPGMQRMNLGNVLRAATDEKATAQALAEARKLPRTGKVAAAKQTKRVKAKAAKEAPAV
jgi:hypothetical protein